MSGRERRLAHAVALVAICVAAGAAVSALSLVGKSYAGFLPFVDATVGNVDQPSWPGVQAGLRYLDQITAADGAPVHDNLSILAAARRAGGRPVHYSVRRGGETLDIAVAPLEFSPARALGALLPLWLMGCLLALLAATIAWIKPGAPFTLPFTLTCLLASFIFFGDVIGTTSAHAWVYALGFYLLPAALAHLGLTFPEPRAVAVEHRWLVPLLWAGCLVEFLVYSATLGSDRDPTTGLHMFTLGLLGAGALALIVNSLWTVLRSSSDLARTRARLFAIAMAGPLITVLAMALAARLHASIPFNVAAAPVLLFLGTIGFGISNNDVFEVDQVFRRSARLLLTLLTAALSAWVLDRALRAAFTALGVDPAYAWIPLVLVVLLAFDRLRSGASWVLERLLYPRAQELRDTAHRSRALFGSARSADEIVGILLRQLESSLGQLDAALLASGPERFALRRGTGAWAALPALPIDDPLVLALRRAPHRLGVEELQEQQLGRGQSGADDALLLARLRQLGARLAIPLHARGELLAILLLGQRRGREPYDSLEEQLVSELSSAAALALDDALAYERLAAFSHQLEERVEERTRQLAEANAGLTRAMQFKSEFIRSVSHELRTPLIAVTGFTELVLERGALPDASVLELGKVQRNARELLLLIEDLLDLGRIEAGKFPLRLGPTDLAAVARDAIAAVEPMAKEKQLSLHLELEGLPEQLQTDGGRVRQILINLLGNAVKFTPRGEVRLRGRVERGQLLLEVRDSGPGIPADQLEAVFGEFVQLGSDARGTGLGLGIARRLARLLGGDLSVRSEAGAGASFTLALPGSLSTPLELAPARAQTRRTLVAMSESPELIVRLRELLGGEGFEVAMAFDLPEVIARARQGKAFAVALEAGAAGAGAVEQGLREALGDEAPPALLLPTPLERGTLLERLRQLGWEP